MSLYPHKTNCVSLYDYELVHIHHEMLTTAESKKIDFDIGELFLLLSCAFGSKGRATWLFNLA